MHLLKIFFFSVALILSACTTLHPPKDFSEFDQPIEYPSQKANYFQGSIYHASTSTNIFEDIRANRVGDTITVLLEEQTAASKSASTNTAKSSAIALADPVVFGRTPTNGGNTFANNSVDSSSEFSGSGDTSQSNSLSGSVTVTVVDVLPNGNLFIRGRKSLSLNQGSEDITVTGIIRPIDITPENTINSGQIANARITYGGEGMIAESNSAGWLTRFFNSGWWPF